jgi:hypothetical protein
MLFYYRNDKTKKQNVEKYLQKCCIDYITEVVTEDIYCTKAKKLDILHFLRMQQFTGTLQLTAQEVQNAVDRDTNDTANKTETSSDETGGDVHANENSVSRKLHKKSSKKGIASSKATDSYNLLRDNTNI